MTRGRGDAMTRRKTNGDMEEEIICMVQKVLRNPSSHGFAEDVTYGEAFGYVCQENPDLARRYYATLPLVTPKQQRKIDAGDKIDALIRAKMKADRHLSFTEAFKQVQTENRELIVQYIGGGSINDNRCGDTEKKDGIILKDLLLLSIDDLMLKILEENQRQIMKWGIQERTAAEWILYLTEEAGEVAKATCEWIYREGNPKEIVKEAIQVATLALKIAEMIEEESWRR